jgi:glucose/mannose-6-phosphate isomerase
MKYLGEQLSTFNKQMEYAMANYQSHGKKIGQFKNIVISGLGGSGITGKIIKSYYLDKISIPVETVSDYQLPKFVNADTLVILCSYSGNTEETLSAYHDAKAKGANCLTVSVGGKMSDLAAADGLLTYRAEGGYQPRVAFGYPITYVFLIFAELLGQDIQSELKEVIEHVSNVEQFKSSSLAVRNFFKENIRNKYVIVASPDMEAVAIRFAQQVQENAKLEAFVVVIPEANHNVIETYYEQWASNYIFLNSGANARINYRFSFIKELLEKYKSPVYEMPMGNRSISHIIEMVFLLDWVSIQIADEVSAVSNQIKNIIDLKEYLSSK